MTDSDIDRLETQLKIVLPTAYRKLVVPFPVPAYARNTDTELWDDADLLLQLNSELRKGSASVDPWPNHLLAMGRDEGGSATAIDLRTEGGSVWWADRCHPHATGSGPTSQTLEEWGRGYVADLRSDLQANGVDPDGTPEARLQAMESDARSGCRLLLALLGACIAIALIVWVAVVALSR